MGNVQEPTDSYVPGGHLADCDRCGFTFRKNQLREKDGLLLCPDDYPKKLSAKDYRRQS